MTNQTIVIKAEPRTLIRKSTLKNMRKNGNIPAVLYSKNSSSPISVTIANLPKEHTRAQLVQLELNGATKTVLMREVQVHPVTHKPLHFDFQEASPDDHVNVHVPLHYVGITKEQEKEAALSILTRYLSVKGKLSLIPSKFEINMSQLKTGESVRLSEVQLPEGVKICSGKGQNVALASLVKI